MGYFEDLTKALDVPLIAFGSANGIKVALENIDLTLELCRNGLCGLVS